MWWDNFKDACADFLVGVLKFVGFIILLIVIIGVIEVIRYSSQTPDSEWNNGICPECEVRYEMKAVYFGGWKYYSCPECGKEVERY